MSIKITIVPTLIFFLLVLPILITCSSSYLVTDCLPHLKLNLKIYSGFKFEAIIEIRENEDVSIFDISWKSNYNQKVTLSWQFFYEEFQYIKDIEGLIVFFLLLIDSRFLKSTSLT